MIKVTAIALTPIVFIAIMNQVLAVIENLGLSTVALRGSRSAVSFGAGLNKPIEIVLLLIQ